MNWSDERWIKLYIRSEADFLALSWQARGLFRLLLTEVDAAGTMQLGRTGLKAVAIAVRAPWSEIQAPLQELLEDGCVTLRDEVSRLVIPNFLDAQQARQSDKARQQARRDRARAGIPESSHGVTPESQDVTPPSRDVTRCHTASRSEENRIDQREKREDGSEQSAEAASSEPAPANDSPKGDEGDMPHEAHANDPEQSGEGEGSSAPETKTRGAEGKNRLCSEPETKTRGAEGKNRLCSEPETKTRGAEGKNRLCSEPDPSQLSEREREAFEAIVGDESLRPIVRMPATLARDLCKVGPGVELKREIAKAGAWLRANPRKAKKNGARFLTTWIEREQEKGSVLPFGGQSHRPRNAYQVQYSGGGFAFVQKQVAATRQAMHEPDEEQCDALNF